MKRFSILLFSLLNIFISPAVFAQDDETFEEEVTVVTPKKQVVKKPTYPTMATPSPSNLCQVS